MKTLVPVSYNPDLEAEPEDMDVDVHLIFVYGMPNNDVIDVMAANAIDAIEIAAERCGLQTSRFYMEECHDATDTSPEWVRVARKKPKSVVRCIHCGNAQARDMVDVGRDAVNRTTKHEDGRWHTIKCKQCGNALLRIWLRVDDSITPTRQSANRNTIAHLPQELPAPHNPNLRVHAIH